MIILEKFKESAWAIFMGIKLSEITQSRDNNYNLMRFLAATAVMYSHTYSLIGEKFHPYAKHFGITLGVFGVDIFFFTSGFLVTASLLRRPDIFAFAWARILRIYPALFIAVIISILIGLYFSSLSLDDYFSHRLVEKFFIRNINLMQGIVYRLPGGVFADNLKHGVNGSLWTLPWEVKMYAALFFIGVMAFFKPFFFKTKGFKIVFSLLMIISLALLVVNYFTHFTNNVRIKPMFRFGYLFFLGATMYTFKDKIYLSKIVFICCILVLALCEGNAKAYFIFHYLFIGYIILCFAYMPGEKIRKFNNLGDYSYGLYIYAYPVTQSVIALNPGITGIDAFFIIFVITLMLSVLSWHLIEKRMLTLKDKYYIIKDKYCVLFGRYHG